jgi:hypothetical protein
MREDMAQGGVQSFLSVMSWEGHEVHRDAELELILFCAA